MEKQISKKTSTVSEGSLVQYENEGKILTGKVFAVYEDKAYAWSISNGKWALVIGGIQTFTPIHMN